MRRTHHVTGIEARWQRGFARRIARALVLAALVAMAGGRANAANSISYFVAPPGGANGVGHAFLQLNPTIGPQNGRGN
jgi:hypothetical protein